MCCYREIKNFDRFIRLTQSIVLCTLQQLQVIQQDERQESIVKEVLEEGKDKEDKNNKRKSNDNAEHMQVEIQAKQTWSQQDREKLFHLLSKIFLLNFPLYIAMKHGGVINPLAPIKVREDLCTSHFYLEKAKSVLRLEHSIISVGRRWILRAARSRGTGALNPRRIYILSSRRFQFDVRLFRYGKHTAR